MELVGTASGNSGQCGITGDVTFGPPLWGLLDQECFLKSHGADDRRRELHSGGASGASGTGASGSSTAGGIAATNLIPVLQTVDLTKRKFDHALHERGDHSTGGRRHDGRRDSPLRELRQSDFKIPFLF